MSDNATVLADETLLSRLDRLFFRLESLLTLLGGIVIFLLILLATSNVLGRWILNLPISGYIDWVEQSMAFFAFLGLAYTQRQGDHIRMDVVVSHIHGRFLWLLELISVMAMLFVTCLLIYGSFLHFLRAYQIGDSSLDINLPTWPAKLVVPVALSILALRFVLQIWGYIRALKGGNKKPVAIPLLEDAASTAVAEAEAVMGNKPEAGL